MAPKIVVSSIVIISFIIGIATKLMTGDAPVLGEIIFWSGVLGFVMLAVSYWALRKKKNPR